MAQNINGYTYHTKYDTYDIIPSDSVQSMGENVLSLVRALSNATELQNTAVCLPSLVLQLKHNPLSL